MGVKKRNKAERLKEQRKNTYYAKLTNCPVPPRKMRLVADLVKGKDVNEALDILRFSPKKASKYLEKVILSAIANWQSKNENARLEEHSLYIKHVYANEGRAIKRLRPAAMGRANIIRKKANHVTVILDSINPPTEEEPEIIEETEQEEDNQ